MLVAEHRKTFGCFAITMKNKKGWLFFLCANSSDELHYITSQYICICYSRKMSDSNLHNNEWSCTIKPWRCMNMNINLELKAERNCMADNFCNGRFKKNIGLPSILGCDVWIRGHIFKWIDFYINLNILHPCHYVFMK